MAIQPYFSLRMALPSLAIGHVSLHQVLLLAGIGDSRYSGMHSLRIGAATAAAKTGVSRNYRSMEVISTPAVHSHIMAVHAVSATPASLPGTVVFLL
jgi:hypothetical protein